MSDQITLTGGRRWALNDMVTISQVLLRHRLSWRHGLAYR